MEITPVPICYGYIRWSSDEQGDGSSDERQREVIAAYANESGWRLEWLPPDAGVSARGGYNLDHGEAAKFKSDIERGKREPGILCVEEPSRLSRADEVDTFDYIMPLLKRGCSVAIASRRQVVTRGDRALLLNLFTFGVEQHGGHQQNESRVGMVKKEVNIRRRDVRGGETIEVGPYAVETVLYTSRLPDWLETTKAPRKSAGRVRRIVQERDRRGEIVREIFELTASFYGGNRLAQLLNQRNDVGDTRYRPWRGDRWTADMIQNLTSNEAVLGWYQGHRVEITIGPDGKKRTKRIALDGERLWKFPKTVSQDLWDRAQAAKSRSATIKSGRPSRQNVNLFAGLCRCGVCGSSMHLMGHNARGKHDRLRCPNKQIGKCINNTHYSVQRLERAFLEFRGRTSGLHLMRQDSDFASTGDDVETAAVRLAEAEKVLANARKQLINAQKAVRESESDAERRVYMQEVRDVLAIEEQAATDRDRMKRELEVARGGDVDEAARRAEFLSDDALGGDAVARVQMAGVIRAILSRVEFKDGLVTVYSARNRRKLIVEGDIAYTEQIYEARKLQKPGA